MTTAHHLDLEPNDPTRSGPPVPAGNGARLSQNEVEQLCLKAARGAGMSWGLAEEAGFAAAWLAMRGLDGPGVLLAQLRDAMDRPWHEICPVVAPGRFQAAEGGCLCPIALGAALCDHARLPETALDETPLRVGPVNHPVLLLAFLSDLAQARGGCVRLDWPGGTVLLTADGQVSGDTALLAKETRLVAELSVHGAAPDQWVQPDAPLFVPSATLSGLNAFALRTTVPASEASRAGAGAAVGDND
ncbi:DUF3726 domain-containing protein [Maliponia aquimaris]|uniref:DUF3726 domain-containing protein n=1 Tax=Maliponia aquimaris TaxID=1673631 RepID=A0A238L784_9RHOB|nr:DUF3726 domain-containing protein [Maliponia aquimaris]SMX50711.1 hypothetical protein MAA8898_04941 [Maliponia aquimaris]